MKLPASAIALFLLSCMTAALSFMLWALFLEKPWLIYPQQPFPVLKTSVAPGEVVPLTVYRCNTSDSTRNYTMSRSIVNEATGSPNVMDDLTTFLAPGCTPHDAESHAHRVPDSLPSGRYRFIGLVAVPGILRTHYVEWRSEVFTVEPP